jgi:hypothetical protein
MFSPITNIKKQSAATKITDHFQVGKNNNKQKKTKQNK